MANGKRSIDENTDPKIAQVIMFERQVAMHKDVTEMKTELKGYREPLAIVKFLLGGFWALLIMVLTALIKVFTIKHGS